jgi:hypothetical protein
MVRAAIADIEAIWAVAPRASTVHVEPIVTVTLPWGSCADHDMIV